MNNQQQSIDFSALVQNNPTNVSIAFQSKLANKLKESFTEEQEKWYVANLYAYLKFHPTNDYVIDLENVFEMIGFAKKGNAKRTLEKHFIKGEDFKVALLRSEKRKNEGGFNKEVLMLNINTFKELCLLANTSKGKEIRKYYLKMEAILNDMVVAQSREYEVELAKKALIIECQEDVNQLLKEEKRLEKPKQKREVQSKIWCWTLNNYETNKMEQLEQEFLNVFCDKWVYGFEVGETGTPHLQGYFVLFDKRRMTEIKKIDEFCHKMHLERRKGSEAEAVRYCVKDGNYRHSDNLPRHLLKPKINRKMDILNPADYWSWQKDVEKIINNNDIDNRSIYWIYEENGNTGKSALTKSICFHYGCLLLNKAKNDDIMHAAFNFEGELNNIIIDIPRIVGNRINYESVESLKNGVIINNKYETGQKLIASPTIIIFSNEMPILSGLSLDRWKVFKIVDKQLFMVNISKAVKQHTVYEDFRWNCVDRDLDANVVENLPPTKITRVQNLGYIAKMNIDKTIILNIYLDRKTAAILNEYPSHASLDNPVKDCKQTRGNYYILYEDLADNIKEKYIIPVLYKNGIGKFDSQENLVKEFINKQDCKRNKELSEKSLAKALRTGMAYNGYFYRRIGEKLSC